MQATLQRHQQEPVQGNRRRLPALTRPLAELPGSRLGASRRGPSWPIRWPKISPASPDEQESFDADKILRRADEPIQEKNVEFAVEFSHGVPADGLFRC